MADKAIRIITDAELRRQIKSGELSGAYLLFGEEDYLKAHAATQIRQAILTDESLALFNCIELDTLELDPAELAQSLAIPSMSFGMDEGKKLILLRGLSFVGMKPSLLDELIDALRLVEEYEHNVVLITVPSGALDAGYLPKRPSATLKKLAQVTTAVHFEEQTPAKLMSWAGRHFEHLGVTAAPELCAALINKCGRSMYVLSQEIEKLAYYVLSTGRAALTGEDVDTVAIASLDCDTFDLTNAIIRGDRAAALSVLEVLRFRRTEPLVILGEISSTLVLMFRVLTQLSYTSNVREIAASTGVHEYRVGVIVRAVSADRASAAERARIALKLCAYADEQLKTQGSRSYEAIERLICGV